MPTGKSENANRVINCHVCNCRSVVVRKTLSCIQWSTDGILSGTLERKIFKTNIETVGLLAFNFVYKLSIFVIRVHK